MRKRTIERRMRLSGLPVEGIGELFKQMHGIDEKDTVWGGKHNDLWVSAVRKVLATITRPIRKEVLQ